MTSPLSMPERDALSSLAVLSQADIEALPWEDVPTCVGVRDKILWRFGDYVQALIHYAPGSSSLGKPHLAAHHHIWVISGEGTIAGRRIGAGSYVHVPPGLPHAVLDVAPEGLTILQTHRPHGPAEADAYGG
jgi:mannose-6-phosphate isomerase-like protein (cupin superfamily)